MVKVLILKTFFLLLLNNHITSSAIMPDLSHVNTIEIHFFKGKQNAIYKTKKTIDLTYLKDLITKSKNEPDLQCDTTGEIIYMENKMPIFKAYFCSRGSGSKYNSTGAVIFQVGQHKITALLNYGAGMLINENFYQLNKLK